MEKPRSGILVLCNDASVYKGMDIETGKQLFTHHFSKSNKEMTEFIGLVHAFMFMKKDSALKGQIYSDSDTGIESIKNKNFPKTLFLDESTIYVWEMAEKCKRWITEQKKVMIVNKWDTAWTNVLCT
jgi:ribonuclease HI